MYSAAQNKIQYSIYVQKSKITEWVIAMESHNIKMNGFISIKEIEAKHFQS
jgi:hypothetical protein